MKTTPFPQSSLARQLSRKPLKTASSWPTFFTTCNIAGKLVVDFGTGLHTDRFEATSSIMPFYPMDLCTYVAPTPEIYVSVEQLSCSADDGQGACFILDAMWNDQCHFINIFSCVLLQTSGCHGCAQNWEESSWETGFRGNI